MEIAIFAKRRSTKDQNRTFFQYITTLDKADGTTETVRVAFRDCDAPKPESCPRNIIINKSDCNMSARRFTEPATGEIKISHTLWVTKWESGSEYVDHSLDEYMFN